MTWFWKLQWKYNIFHQRNLLLHDPWNWLLTEFASCLLFLIMNGVWFSSFFLLGPGCSSLGVGAFSENGPFRPSGNVLVRNEYSWNRGTLWKKLLFNLSFFASMGVKKNNQKTDFLYYSPLQKQTCYTWRHQLELAPLTQLIPLHMWL